MPPDIKKIHQYCEMKDAIKYVKAKVVTLI